MRAFANYYDLIYQNKDYHKEVKNVLTLLNIVNNDSNKKIIEVGSGTGNHTLEFSKFFNEVHAFELDSEISRIGSKKVEALSNVYWYEENFLSSPIKKKFEYSCALFNVVNYFLSFNDLYFLFKKLYKLLKVDGFFIFDCWNGILALVDQYPDDRREFIVEKDKILVQEISTKIEEMSQSAHINYIYKISKNSSIHSIGSEVIKIRLWTV
jgi:SAM-dependent methyltransferase